MPWRLRLAGGFASRSLRFCLLVAAACPPWLFCLRCLIPAPLAPFGASVFECSLSATQMTTIHRVMWKGDRYTYELDRIADLALIVFTPKKGDEQSVKVSIPRALEHLKEVTAKWQTYQKQRAYRLRKKEEAAALQAA